MKTSCIKHKQRSRIIILKEDFLGICDNNKAAALLLGFFEYWHNIKLEQKQKAYQYNEIAEKHGDKRTQDETLYQWHTRKQLYEGLMGLVGEKSISSALKLLEEKEYISIHRNPNPRYSFDSTKFFLLHPQKINKAIANDPIPSMQIIQPVCANHPDGLCKSSTTSTKGSSKFTSKITHTLDGVCNSNSNIKNPQKQEHTYFQEKNLDTNLIEKIVGNLKEVLEGFHKKKIEKKELKKWAPKLFNWMAETEINPTRVEEAIFSIEKYMDEEYFPDIHTMRDFTTKFSSIEVATNKLQSKNRTKKESEREVILPK